MNHPLLHKVAIARLEDPFQLPMQRLPLNWGAADKAPEVEYVLAIDQSHIYLAGRVTAPAWFYEDSQPGCFRKGLWERDVLELFLKDDESSAYQEFNLSPAGEWWSCHFEAPRAPSVHDCSTSKVRTFHLRSQTHWRAVLALPRESLAVKFSAGDASRLNVCACIGRQPVNYFSAARLPGLTPDFHQPACFLPVPLERTRRGT